MTIGPATLWARSRQRETVWRAGAPDRPRPDLAVTLGCPRRGTDENGIVLATERRQGEGPPQVGPEADPLGHIPRCSLGRTGGAEDTDVGGSAPCQQLSYPRPGERLHEAAAGPSVSSCEPEPSPRRMEQRAENASPPGHKTTHKLPSDGMSPAGLVDGEIYSIRAEGTQVTNITANNPTDPAAPPVGDIMPAWGRARRRHLTRVGSVVGRPAQSTSRTTPYARVWPE